MGLLDLLVIYDLKKTFPISGPIAFLLTFLIAVATVNAKTEDGKKVSAWQLVVLWLFLFVMLNFFIAKVVTLFIDPKKSVGAIVGDYFLGDFEIQSRKRKLNFI